MANDRADPSSEFYADLASFSDFGDFTDFEAYAPVPDDWVVLCGDIRGSTRAIEEGHYKQVNMVGAAVITAVLNACPGLQIPYVFGGDGGLAAVPGPEARLKLSLSSERAIDIWSVTRIMPAGAGTRRSADRRRGGRPP